VLRAIATRQKVTSYVTYIRGENAQKALLSSILVINKKGCIRHKELRLEKYFITERARKAGTYFLPIA